MLRGAGCAFVWLVCSATPAGQTIAETDPQFGKLREWILAADTHVPGKQDAAAAAIAQWSPSEADDVLPYVRAVGDFTEKRVARARVGRTTLTKAATAELADIADDVSAAGGFSRLILRGATLHADVAIWQWDAQRGLLDAPPKARTSVARADASVLAVDGRVAGVDRMGPHWRIGRTLMYELRPGPEGHPLASLWYKATIAYLLDSGVLDEVVPHVNDARKHFPKDATIAFAAGCVFETFSSPRIQAAVEASGRPADRSSGGIGTAQWNVREAEVHFQRALTLDARFTEARIRLGRLLGIRERHEQGIKELNAALSDTRDPLLRFWAYLFLAAQHESLGRSAPARRAYEAAAALYPRAQSPHLGMSQLARRMGDRAGAVRAMESVLALSPGERDDPWWQYYGGIGRNAKTLLAELYAVVAAR